MELGNESEGIIEHPAHILKQEFYGYGLLMRTGQREEAERMRLSLIEKIRQIGGLGGFKRQLVELQREGIDIGTFEGLGIEVVDDLSWVPEDLR